MGNKKLGTIAVGSGIGHREDARSVVPEIFMELVFELISRTPGTRPLGATGLDHEVSNDTVECQTIVEAVIGEFLEIFNRLGHLVVVQLYSNVSFVRLNQRDFHRGCFVSLKKNRVSATANYTTGCRRRLGQIYNKVFL